MYWQVVQATAEKPWDRLCDHLRGRGVPNLEEALLDLELAPVHEALRRVLDADAIRHMADMVAQHVAAGDARAAAKSRVARRAAMAGLWPSVRVFLEEAQEAYRAQLWKKEGRQAAQLPKTLPDAMQPSFQELFGRALQLPAAELLFPEVWPAAARRVLPSESPGMPVASLWAPVLAWCVVALLSESFQPEGGGEKAPDVAAKVFDLLRLRKAMAEAFQAFGLEGELCWRAAARVRLALPAEKAAAKRGEKATGGAGSASATWMGLSEDMWKDSEVRWLLAWNAWEGHTYVAKESYEELLWWLQLPRLCRLTGRKATDRKTATKLQTTIEEACRGLAKLHYRVDHVADGKTEDGKAQKDGVVKSTGTAAEKRATHETLPPKRPKATSRRKTTRRHSKKKPKK